MGGEISIRAGKVLGDSLGYTPQFGLGLSDTRALFQPSQYKPPTSPARGILFRRLQAPKMLGSLGCKRELFRHDPDNFGGLAVDLDHSTHNVGIASELALPEPVTHHDDFGALIFFFPCECSPQSGPRPQHRKETGRRQRRAHPFWFLPSGQQTRRWIINRQVFESSVLLPPVKIAAV